MADLVDVLGRKLDSSNMTLGEIKGLIGSLMKSKVGTARPVGDKEKSSPVNAAIIDLKKLFEKYVKDFQREADEQKDLTQKVVDSIKELNDAKKNRRMQPTDKKSEKKQTSIEKSLKGIFQAGVVKKHSLATKDARVLEAINNLAKVLESVVNKNTTTGGSGGGGGGAVTTASGQPGDRPKKGRTKSFQGKDTPREIVMTRQLASDVAGQVSKLEQALSGFSAVGTVFDGVIDKEREFIQDIRRVAYETDNGTKSTKELNRQYENIGNTVAQTGKNRTEFQDEYRKILRSGIKDLSKANSMVKTQLNTEEQLNLKAGELGEEFKNWTIAGKMSVVQIGQMGRNMREVARNTGLSGDAMKAAVSASSAFMKNLRNAAQLSANSAGNILELAANAQKLDIASEMEPLMNAMTSSSNLLLESSEQTRAFLFSAAGSVGRMQELQQGTILQSKSGINSMAKGIENVMKNFGIESMDAIDKLSDDAKLQLNLSLKSSFGIELGQVQRVFENLQETGKTYAERLDSINKKQQKNLTAEERLSLEEQKRRMIADQNLKVLTALDEASKNAGTGMQGMQDTFSSFTDSVKKKFGDDLGSMGLTDAKGELKDTPEIIKKTMLDAVQSVNEGLKKAGEKEIKLSAKDIEAALQSNDPAKFRELTKQISDGNERLATSQKKSLNPMDQMNQNLMELNESLRKITNSGISALFNSVLGQLAALGIAIAGLVSALAFSGINLWTTFAGFENTLGELGLSTTNSAEAIAEAGDDLLKAANDMKKAPKPTQKVNLADAKLNFKSSEQEALSKALGGFEVEMKAVSSVTDDAAKAAANAAEASSKATKSTFTLFQRIKEIPGRFTKGFKVAERSGVGFIRSVDAGFSSAAKGLGYRKVTKGLQSVGDTLQSLSQSEKPIKNTLTMLKTSAGNVFETITQKFTTHWGEFGKKFLGVVSDVEGPLTTGLGKVGTGLTKFKDGFWALTKANWTKNPMVLAKQGFEGFKVGMQSLSQVSLKAAGGMLRAAGKISPLTLAFMALDVAMGSMDAASKATQIFGKQKQEDLTLNEEYAAKTAGAITGLLNGLTLGLLGLFIDLDKVTASLAQFNAKIPILTLILSPLIVALEAVWGVIKGIGYIIYDIFYDIYATIVNIVTPVFEGLTDVFSVLGSIFSGTSDSTKGLTNSVTMFGGVAELVAKILRYTFMLTTPLGLFLKTLRVVSVVIGFVNKAFLKVIEGIIAYFKPMLQQIVGAFYDVFSGISAILAPFGEMISYFTGLLGSLFGVFSSGKKEGFGFMDAMLLLGKAIGLVLNVMLFPLITTIYIVGGAFKILGGILKLIGAFIMSIWKMDFSILSNAFHEVLKGLYDYAMSFFSGFLRAFNFKGIGSWLYKNITEGMAGIGTWLYENTIKPFVDFGNWLYNEMTNIFSKVMDYVLSFIPGGKTVKATAQAFSATEEENRKRVEEEGAGYFTGIGRALGGIMELNAQKTLGGLAESNSAVLNAVNPFNYFEEGTKKVQQDGLAMLHKDEMVVPANKVDKLTAEGNGAFGNGPISNFLSSLVPKMPPEVNDMFKSLTSFVPQEVNDLAKGFTSLAPQLFRMTPLGQLVGSMQNSFGSSLQPINNTRDIQTAVAAEKASTSPSKSEVTSGDLGTIATESEEQNEKLDILIDLFTQVVKYMKPTSSPISSSGGSRPDTSMNKIGHKTPNYFRNNIGLVVQNPGKAVLNLGPQNI